MKPSSPRHDNRPRTTRAATPEARVRNGLAGRAGRLAAIVLVAALALGHAAAQTTRIAILPFDTEADGDAYQLGLPAALQHALNQLPGVYAPPIGDVAVMANRAANADLGVEETLTAVFNATAVVTGRVTTNNDGLVVDLTIAAGGPSEGRVVSGADPARVTLAAAQAVAALVVPDASAEGLSHLESAARQTPSVASLGPTGLSASGLPGVSADALGVAAQLDAGSGWVLAEYARALALDGRADEAREVANRANDAAPTDAEVAAIVGLVLDAVNDDGALNAFERAVSINPSHAVALAGKADWEDTNQNLEASIEAYPRLALSYVQLADLQPDLQRAIQVLRRAEDHLPDSVLLRGHVISRLIEAGDTSGAVAYLQQALSEPLARSGSMYALARLLPLSATAADTILEQGVEAYPTNLELRLAQAERLIDQDRVDDAIGLLEPLNAQDPTRASVASLLAVAQARAGNPEAARATFEALRGSGVDVDAGLAELYLASGQAAAAVPLLERLVAEKPDDSMLQALYGTALTRLGRLTEGRTVLERAVELDPTNQYAANSLDVASQQRALTGGDVSFSEAAGVAFQQGLGALESRDYDAATEAFGRSRAEQETGLAAFYQGYSRQRNGQTRAAIDDYVAALEEFAENDVVLNNLGFAYVEIGRYDKALEYLRRAVAANDGNAQAKLNLGIVYRALTRYEDAIDMFTQAAALDPSLAPTTDPLIQDLRSRLDQ